MLSSTVLPPSMSIDESTLIPDGFFWYHCADRRYYYDGTKVSLSRKAFILFNPDYSDEAACQIESYRDEKTSGKLGYIHGHKILETIVSLLPSDGRYYKLKKSSRR